MKFTTIQIIKRIWNTKVLKIVNLIYILKETTKMEARKNVEKYPKC